MYNNSLNISLESILAVKPSIWESSDYSGKNHVTINLCSSSNEYEEIKTAIRSVGIDTNISKIERVQHPFAFARYMIRKEQLEQRNECPSEVRKFYYISQEQAIEALECNMDKRRVSSLGIYSFVYSFQNDLCIIITKALGNCTKSRDSEEYPEYIIYFDK